MAIKRNTRVNETFSSSTMSDLVFLLLIFFLITSTLINNNALNLNLPKSTNQQPQKTQTDVAIRYIDIDKYEYYFASQLVNFEDLEPLLQKNLKENTDPAFSISADENVPVGEVVRVMNIAKRNGYKVLLATSPE